MTISPEPPLPPPPPNNVVYAPPDQAWHQVAPPAATRRSPWVTVGIIVAVLAVIAGLVVVGFFILAIVALSSWGSNK